MKTSAQSGDESFQRNLSPPFGEPAPPKPRQAQATTTRSSPELKARLIRQVLKELEEYDFDLLLDILDCDYGDKILERRERS